MSISENELQSSVMEYLCRQYFKAWECTLHPKNEGSKKWRKTFMGNSSGAPDLIMLYPVYNYYGLMIELKSLKGTVSPEQADWLARLSIMGFKTATARTFEEAKTVIDDYMGGRK